MIDTSTETVTRISDDLMMTARVGSVNMRQAQLMEDAHILIEALHDRAETAEANSQKALEHLKFCLMRLDELVLESGRSIEYGEEDSFRRGEWFESRELMAIEEARTVLAEMKEN